jgi:hypothetical protein
MNDPAGPTKDPSTSRPPTDTRSQRRTLDRNLARAVIIFLVGVGGLLIALIYGPGPALLGIGCLFGGAALFGLIWLILTLMQRWAGED